MEHKKYRVPEINNNCDDYDDDIFIEEFNKFCDEWDSCTQCPFNSLSYEEEHCMFLFNNIQRGEDGKRFLHFDIDI